MKKNNIEEEFINFLNRRIKRDGSAYGSNYIKDKLSRLRKLENLFGPSELANINKDNYFDLADSVMKKMKKPIGKSTLNYVYGDYMVVVRLLYEMNNNGRKAPRYAFYAGKKREPK